MGAGGRQAGEDSWDGMGQVSEGDSSELGRETGVSWRETGELGRGRCEQERQVSWREGLHPGMTLAQDQERGQAEVETGGVVCRAVSISGG